MRKIRKYTSAYELSDKLQNNNLVNEEIRENGFISWGLGELFSGQNENLTLNHQHLCQNCVCMYL